LADKHSGPAILIVDDVPETIDVSVNVLKDSYRVHVATSGKLALKIAAEKRLDAILLDIMMPEMDGFEVCRRLKQDDCTKQIPVVFLTALAATDDVVKGLSLGALYYLTKPVLPAQLKAVVASATQHYQALRALEDQSIGLSNAIRLVDHARFSFRTLDDVEALAALTSQVCPSPERSLVGLSELLINAVEHGNLGIGYQEKSDLNEAGRWHTEVERRLALPENLSKFATLDLRRDSRQIRFTIIDQGQGFDWQSYLEIDPLRAFDNHGRGVAIAKSLSFDELEYRGTGSEVEARIHSPADSATES
jgi:CheY-like chemotaxis protein/anti-sigma regulatory factor (Ser/Thr protein kinase)